MNLSTTYTDPRVPGVSIKTGETLSVLQICEGDVVIRTIEGYSGSNSSFAEGYFEALAPSDPQY